MLFKKGDRVLLPLNETGTFLGIEPKPWGHDHIVKIRKATFNLTNQRVLFRNQDLKLEIKPEDARVLEVIVGLDDSVESLETLCEYVSSSLTSGKLSQLNRIVELIVRGVGTPNFQVLQGLLTYTYTLGLSNYKELISLALSDLYNSVSLEIRTKCLSTLIKD